MNKTKLLNCAAGLSLLLAVGAQPTFAQVEEIIVTATKRAENAQDIAVAVTALGEDFLEEQRVEVFTDYLLQLPGVNAAAAGPGQGTIYIRGVASSSPGTSTAVAAGIAPNVALYLDEQPVSQIGRNLDVYAADLQRVEVLPGPQGTLFGGSSQAGTVRLITNKPKLGVEEAKFSTGVSFTEGGEASYKFEATYNLPIGDDTAIRITGFQDNQGGYIDNVPGELDIRDNSFFRRADVVRANGTLVGGAAGPGATRFETLPSLTLDPSVDPFFAGLTGGITDNAQFVEDDINDTTYTGARAAIKHEFNEDWNALASIMHQEIDSDGVFFRDPELDGDDGTSISRFRDENLADEFTNVAWTVEGRLGLLDLVYTGAFNNHDFDQAADYSGYAFTGTFLPYYICDYYGVYNDIYTGDNQVGPVGECGDPTPVTDIENRTEVTTHELRFTTPSEKSLRATGGIFVSEQEITERINFTYLGAPTQFVENGGIFSAPNRVLQSAPFTDGSFQEPNATFINDITRSDDQYGLFGEVSYDLIPDTLTITGGARAYRVETDFDGSSNNRTAFFGGADNDRGFNLTDIFDGNNSFISLHQGQGNQNANGVDTTLFLSGADDGISAAALALSDLGGANATGAEADDLRAIILAGTNEQSVNFARILNGGGNGQLANQQLSLLANPVTPTDKHVDEGVVVKANVSWTPSDDVLLYATYSEGFRPGSLNRPVIQNPAVIASEVDTDELTNYEFGWKTRLFDNQLQFNGSAFYEEISDLQSTIQAPSISSLLFSGNVADAEVTGVEADFIYAPADVQGLTISGALSLLNSEVTAVLPGPDGNPSVIPIAPVGSDLPFAPEVQGNIRARYEWGGEKNPFTKYVSAQASYTSDSFSDIVAENRAKQDSYFLLGASAGFTTEKWGLEAYVDNITDERAVIFNHFVNDVERQTINRPRTYGLRTSYSFQ